MSFGIFVGRVIHAGQQNTDNSPMKCTKCLQDGHYFSKCPNEWVCIDCGETVHKKSECKRGDPSDTEQSTAEPDSSDDESPNDQPIDPEITNANKSPGLGTKPKQSTRRGKQPVQNEKHENQKSILNFVTPIKYVPPSKLKSAKVAERSPPTPAEELHDKLNATKKVNQSAEGAEGLGLNLGCLERSVVTKLK
ncbi:hypothetical protein DPMN_110956 [Dreissena polymorpha]|uniref:CCHC-type domain-containing protein n=1 Tax=Dreissena polymorpha TaxID=45954 RepID=A0A9D4KD04_DREPO|nr:hypothetical protein DPMN_110956 [Dreissena polymorpha]